MSSECPIDGAFAISTDQLQETCYSGFRTHLFASLSLALYVRMLCLAVPQACRIYVCT